MVAVAQPGQSARSWPWRSGVRVPSVTPRVRSAGTRPGSPPDGFAHGSAHVSAPSSSGLGRLPFKQVTRVRIPLGLPTNRRRLPRGPQITSPPSRPAGWSWRRELLEPQAGARRAPGPARRAPGRNPPVPPAARRHQGPIVQRPRTPPSQGRNTGSNPVGATNRRTGTVTCHDGSGVTWKPSYTRTDSRPPQRPDRAP